MCLHLLVQSSKGVSALEPLSFETSARITMGVFIYSVHFHFRTRDVSRGITSTKEQLYLVVLARLQF